MSFSREIYPDLINSAISPKLSLIFGARQTGKTFLLKKLGRELKDHQYFNLEFPKDSRIFDISDEEIFNLLTTSSPYIFIDEFHYIKNVSQIFKAVYDWCDLHPEIRIKIFASGSSAIEMHKHIKESMAGRFKKFTIRPLSYDEYLSNPQIKTSLNDYLIYGGLPGVYDPKENHSHNDRQEYLKTLLAAYIQKDIKSLVDEENISSFNNLVYLLASWQGQIISSSTLATETRTGEKTIERYIDILEQTFVLYKLKSFAKNLSNELKKSKKYYLYDLGIRNALLSNFNIKNRDDIGAIMESFSYHHLLSLQKANTELYFWRTSDQVEIDFIWLEDRIPTPIEVKSKLNRPEVPKAFKTFFRAYPNAPMGIVINQKINETIWFMEKPVHFVSFENISELKTLLQSPDEC